MKNKINSLITNVYRSLDEIDDMKENILNDLEQIECETYFINDNEYIEIDELISMLETEKLINNELNDFLEKLKFRRK